MHSTKTFRVVADPAAVSMAAAISVVAGTAPLFIMTRRALDDLAVELGGRPAAAAFLREVVESIGRPVGVSVPTGPETLSTAFIAPRSWTDERLAGWIGGHHEILEAEFGEVSRVGRPR